MNKLNKMVLKGVLFFGMALFININNIDAKSKTVDTSDIVIYENTEEEVEIDLKNTCKTKQTASFKFNKGKIKVIKDNGKYYVKSLNPGKSKVKIIIKTKTKNKRSSKVYTIKVTGLADDGGKTDDLLFEKITNGLKSTPECKIKEYKNIEWNEQNRNAMNAIDYLYSHLNHKFKDGLAGFEYVYDKKSDQNDEYFLYSVERHNNSYHFNAEGQICMIPDYLLFEMVTYYAVKTNFKDKKIEAEYKKSPYVDGVKVRKKNYFLYKMCDRYWSMLDPEVLNVIDPKNEHHLYLKCKWCQDEDHNSIDNYKPHPTFY